MSHHNPNHDSDGVFNRSRLVRSVNGDTETLQRLAKLFLEDSPRQLNAMRDALTRGDSCMLEHVAHRLKGTAGYFAADRAFAAAAHVETIARSGDLDCADEACAKLVREILRLARAFAEFDAPGPPPSRPAPLLLGRRSRRLPIRQ